MRSRIVHFALTAPTQTGYLLLSVWPVLGGLALYAVMRLSPAAIERYAADPRSS